MLVPPVHTYAGSYAVSQCRHQAQAVICGTVLSISLLHAVVFNSLRQHVPCMYLQSAMHLAVQDCMVNTVHSRRFLRAYVEQS